MVRFFQLIVILSLPFVLSTAHGAVGEIQQITHENLIAFGNLPGACIRKGTLGARFSNWMYFDYRDGGNRVRRYAQEYSTEIEGVEEGADPCREAMMTVFGQESPWASYLNDIKNDNLTVAGRSGCEQKYLVATLGEQVRLSDQSIADVGVLKESERAVQCP